MKKSFLSVVALIVVGLTVFTSYKTFSPNSTVTNLMLDENIEALTAGESKPCIYRVLPCYSTSGSECGWSNQDRETCCYKSYC